MSDVRNEDLPDSPIVKRLKEIDDKYLEIQREFDRERSELAKRYTEKQQEFIVRRKELLTAATQDSAKTGTPALTGFWCKALQNHEAFQDKIKEWDEPVLEYLSDVDIERFDPESKGFKVILRFAENPYFSNKDLSVEYHTAEANPYLDTVDVSKVVSSTINWKEGQDVTVQKVAKKAKGGGAKKAKQKKEQEQARPSFFTEFISSLHKGLDAEVVAAFLGVDAKEITTPDGEIAPGLLSNVMEAHYELGVALRDNIVPFAVRWYTGEACVDDGDDGDDDDDDEEEESESEASDDDDEEDDDDDNEAEEESLPAAKAKPAAKKKKDAEGGSSEAKPKGKEEDCKQQ